MRVNRAKELLRQTDRSLSEIAIECGFFDQSHFNKSFRAATACSPGEFRKRRK
jgi:AraC family transcriptional regulator